MKRYVGIILPGILVAATGVGAGDLITAGLAGMRVGYAILWAIPLGVLLKWVLTEGLARWQLATGTSLFEGWVRRLGRPVQWIFLVYLFFWSFVVGGALINACGVAGAALVPVGNPQTARIVWGCIHALGGIILVSIGGFKLFEKVMGAAVGLMFVMVLTTAVCMAPAWGSVLKGLTIPVMPTGGIKWILGLLGGVGGTVTVLSYGYWIREKGRTGEQGMAVCRLDLTIAYVLTGLFSVAMVIIARPLAAGGIKGVQLAVAVADQLGSVLGPWARLMFLLGFWGAVFSSLLGVWQGVPYLFADFIYTRRKHHEAAGTSLVHTPEYRWYLWGMGIVPLITLWLKFEAVQVTYAVMGAFFMPFLAVTLLILNNRTVWVGTRFRNGPVINLLLIGTLLLFGYTGGQKLVQMVSGLF